MQDGLSSENFSINGSLTDVNTGRFRVTNLGSPAVYGGYVQAGTVTTSAGSVGTVTLGRNFSDTTYSIVFTGSGTATVAFMSPSGTVAGYKTISGCGVIGGASSTYNYVAVGI